MTHYYASARQTGKGLQVDTHSRGIHATFDEPQDLGGTNTGMNPVELELSLIGASLQQTANYLAPEENFTYRKLTVSLEGDLDLAGFQGDADIRNGFQEIRIQLTFETDESLTKCQEFVEIIKLNNPLVDTLTHGLKIVVDNVERV